MKILVINGNTDNPSFSPYTEAIEAAIVNNDHHEIEYFRLKDMTINYCTGCWSCWYKTPGLCAINDDNEQILSRIPNADLILYISPIIMGYESSLLKTCKDRNIAVAHPYILLHNGEQHHHKRYENTPNISALMISDDMTNDADINLIKDTYERMALNFHASVHSFDVINTVGGVQDVFNRI